jgi:hypothetical protein
MPVMLDALDLMDDHPAIASYYRALLAGLAGS